MRALDRLTGHWVGADPSPATAASGHGEPRAAYDARLDLAGTCIVARASRRGDSRRTQHALHVFGWDEDMQRYSLHVFDSAEGRVTEPAFGTWKGRTLVLERGRDGGRERFAFSLRGSRLRLTVESEGEDGWTATAETTYHRTGP